MSKLQQIDLDGAPRAMGRAFGEHFRDGVREFTEMRISRLIEFVARFDPQRGLTREAALAVAERCIPAHRDFAPAVWDEFAGIAEGAGLAEPELLIGNGLTDLRDLVLFENQSLRGRCQAHMDECSAIVAPSEASGEPGPIVAQTWDMHADAIDYLAVVRRRPDDAPATVGLTTVGCQCLIGLNSEGVAVGNTNLVPTDARVGVNYLATITAALACRSADAAADRIEQAPRLSGHNFYVADPHAAINLETTATRVVRTRVADAPFVHTNHYLSPELAELEFTDRELDNSRWRCDRLQSHAANLPAPLSVDALWNALAAVTQGPGGACDLEHVGIADAATVATVLMSPAAGRIRVSRGFAAPDTPPDLDLTVR
jgi:isopenicillin-N N-acyltransferase-like protein